jgi:hypothetical protein
VARNEVPIVIVLIRCSFSLMPHGCVSMLVVHVVQVVHVVLSEQVFERTHVRFLAHPTDTRPHWVEHMFDFHVHSG